jgi:hypothetical protein
MVEIKRRRSFEAGHRLKFMVLVDETPECDRAALRPQGGAPSRPARIGMGDPIDRITRQLADLGKILPADPCLLHNIEADSKHFKQILDTHGHWRRTSDLS